MESSHVKHGMMPIRQMISIQHLQVFEMTEVPLFQKVYSISILNGPRRLIKMCIMFADFLYSQNEVCI